MSDLGTSNHSRAESTVGCVTAAAADYAVVWAPPQQFLDEQPNLRAVFNLGVGVDALTQLKLPPQTLLVRLDDAGMSVQMAEYVCHGLIRHFREFDHYERDVAQGKWSYRRPRLREEFPVGLMGLGVLGQRVARAIQLFEFPVLGWSRSPKQVPGARCYAGESQFSEFLAETRVLVCLLPLTDETQGILCRETLSQLQAGGCIISVARGAHLVEEDLIPLLDSGQLAGATLDVFRQEPLPAWHPFWRHPRSPSRRTRRHAPCATKAWRRSPPRLPAWSAGNRLPVSSIP